MSHVRHYALIGFGNNQSNRTDGTEMTKAELVAAGEVSPAIICPLQAGRLGYVRSCLVTTCQPLRVPSERISHLELGAGG